MFICLYRNYLSNTVVWVMIPGLGNSLFEHILYSMEGSISVICTSWSDCNSVCLTLRLSGLKRCVTPDMVIKHSFLISSCSRRKKFHSRACVTIPVFENKNNKHKQINERKRKSSILRFFSYRQLCNFLFSF